jgi:hypothetical protein
MMIWVCFLRSGIGNAAILSSQETFNREFFIEKIRVDFDEELAQNQPMKYSRNTFLYRDNATPHQALRDFDCLRIIRLSHPPYNSDLALCGFRLSGKLKKLERATFASPNEVITKVSTILSKILFEVFIPIFDKWKCMLRECIDRREKYL